MAMISPVACWLHGSRMISFVRTHEVAGLPLDE
jgi:hypothetical protein